MTTSDTLQKARERAKEMGLPYEGALTPQEAHEVLQQTPAAKLVDVRTRAELDWVGRVPGAVEVELLDLSRQPSQPRFREAARSSRSTRTRPCCSSAAAAAARTTPR